MTLLNILVGLVGLGIVVLVHEFGHFLVAKLSGITVEVFSIGWGKKAFGFTRGDTEYRISVFPIGGYCKMKGEEILRSAVEKGADTFPEEKGSLFSVSPWKRIGTYVAGPAANFVFAVVVLSIIWFAGFSVRTFESRIILLSETPFAERTRYPADDAGFHTGDRIVEMNGKEIATFQDLENQVAPNPGRTIETVVERNGKLLSLTVVPELDRETGAGVIGVAAWVEPSIATVSSTGAAQKAGLQPRDRIIEANGVTIATSIDLVGVTRTEPESINLTFLRNHTTHTTTLRPSYTEAGNPDMGFSFRTVDTVKREANPLAALRRGTAEAFETFVLSIRSIGLLFRGVNVRNAVSGPIRITYFVGEIATRSFQEGFSSGMNTLFRFLSLLSVALGFMNLLPIPALDGGMILFLIGELILGHPVKPKVFQRYQIVGFLIILSLLVFTTFNDVFFFMRS